MEQVAKIIHHVFGGVIGPNHITWIGFLMHFPIAILIGLGDLWQAAVLLVVFGLFDTLDGSLARLQDRVSDVGGMLDAVTDRLKEILIYSGVVYLFLQTNQPEWTMVAALVACGASIVVAYVKSKGETIVASQKKKLDYPTLNRLFGGGLLPFEARMTIVVIGLLAGVTVLKWLVLVLAAMSVFTVFQRMYRISKVVG